MSSNKDYLTTETPWKALLVFLIPIVVGNVFQKLYVTADSIIVGRLVGEEALAAIGACNSLTNVFISVAIGGGIGASVIAGRDFGARQYRGMKTAVFTAILSFLVLSVLLGGFGWFCCRDILRWLKTPSDVLEMAADYLGIYFLGLPFLFLYNVLSAMFNALGKSRIPLYFLIFSSLLNVGLDYWFVAGLDLGVPGVAWGTLIAQGLSALLSLAVFLRTLRGLDGKGFRLFAGSTFREISGIALPSILQQCTITMGYLFIQSVVNSFGTQVMAGFSAAWRVEGLFVVPLSSICNAMSAYTAQNLGAGRQDRVRSGLRSALTVDGIFAVLIAIACCGFPEPIGRLFLGDDCSPAALSAVVSYLRFTGWFYMLIGSKMAVDGVLRGSGDTFMFTVANLVNLGFRVLVSVTMAPRYGARWIWFAVPIGWAINLLISGGEFLRGKWKRTLVKE